MTLAGVRDMNFPVGNVSVARGFQVAVPHRTGGVPNWPPGLGACWAGRWGPGWAGLSLPSCQVKRMSHRPLGSAFPTDHVGALAPNYTVYSAAAPTLFCL